MPSDTSFIPSERADRPGETGAGRSAERPGGASDAGMSVLGDR